MTVTFRRPPTKTPAPASRPGRPAAVPVPDRRDPRLAFPIKAMVSRILQAGTERPIRQVMIMGASPGAGASTVAAEIAREMVGVHGQVLLARVSAARAGEGAEAGRALERVLAVGEDPLVHLDLGSREFMALVSNVPAGLTPVMSRLSARFPLVVWDMPSAAALPGGAVAAGLVDGCILVVEAQRTRRQVLRHAADTLNQAGGRILGVVMNKTRSYIPDVIYRLL